MISPPYDISSHDTSNDDGLKTFVICTLLLLFFFYYYYHFSALIWMSAVVDPAVLELDVPTRPEVTRVNA